MNFPRILKAMGLIPEALAHTADDDRQKGIPGERPWSPIGDPRSRHGGSTADAIRVAKGGIPNSPPASVIAGWSAKDRALSADLEDHAVACGFHKGGLVTGGITSVMGERGTGVTVDAAHLQQMKIDLNPPEARMDWDQDTPPMPADPVMRAICHELHAQRQRIAHIERTFNLGRSR